MRICVGMLALVAVACASAPGDLGPDHIPTRQSETRRQFIGFSVAPPRGEGWWLRVKEQSPDRALFRYELLETPHTFFVAAERVGLAHAGESIEEFGDRLLRARTEAPGRYEILESRSEPDDRWGPRCRSYELRLLDKRVPGWNGPPLELLESGFACLHPTIESFFIVAYYSERGPQGTLRPDLHDEGRAFLRALQVESAPGVPVD